MIPCVILSSRISLSIASDGYFTSTIPTISHLMGENIGNMFVNVCIILAVVSNLVVVQTIHKYISRIPPQKLSPKMTAIKPIVDITGVIYSVGIVIYSFIDVSTYPILHISLLLIYQVASFLFFSIFIENYTRNKYGYNLQVKILGYIQLSAAIISNILFFYCYYNRNFSFVYKVTAILQYVSFIALYFHILFIGIFIFGYRFVQPFKNRTHQMRRSYSSSSQEAFVL